MDSETAKKLLDKYWNCETTLKEEELLRTYFQQNEVPEDIKKFQKLFKFFNEEKRKELTDDFDHRVLDFVKKDKKGVKQKYLSHMYKVAAAVLLILSFVVIHERFIDVRVKTKKVVEDTFKDPKKALEETKKALFLVSEKLNKGKEEVSRLYKFKKAEEVVKNSNYKEI